MIEGKIANQIPRIRLNGKVNCAKCCKTLSPPNSGTFAAINGESIFTIYSYIGTDYWIYESKSGAAVVYCSKYCRNKHNHRFA